MLFIQGVPVPVRKTRPIFRCIDDQKTNATGQANHFQWFLALLNDKLAIFKLHSTENYDRM